MIGGGDPFYLKFWIKLTALEQIADFRSDSAVTLSEKVELALTGSPLRAFQ